MAIDINWNLLTDSSANLGNALMQGGQKIGERRKEARTNNALAAYVEQPEDRERREALLKINPLLALQMDDIQRKKVAQLQEDQRKELGMSARVFANVADDAGYLNGVATMKRLGFDVSDYPTTFDPAHWKEIVRLGGYVNQVDPVKVGEGDVLINPQTGQVVGRGNPKPQRYYPVAAGGMLVPEPGSGGANVPTITADQYAALPPGSQFIAADDPSRQIRIKQ